MTPEMPSDPPAKRLELPGGVVTWTDEGQGVTVVALHGLPGSVRDFRWLAPALRDGVRFVRIDQPGFGGTALSSGPGSGLPARADFVCAVIDALDLGPVVLMGHSMGGAVAAAVAARRPDLVSSLVLVCSIGIKKHRGMKFWPIPPQIVSVLLRVGPLRRRLLPNLRAAFEKSGFKGHEDQAILQTVHCVAGTSFALHERHLRSLRVPTMLVWTKDDPMIEESISDKLYWICPAGPRVVFEDGGHNPQKAKAVELAAALTAWIANRPGTDR